MKASIQSGFKTGVVNWYNYLFFNHLPPPYFQFSLERTKEVISDSF